MSASSDLRVTCYEGRPDSSHQSVELDAAVAVPSALVGLRQILAALREYVPEAIDGVAASRPAEWNALFPGTFPQTKALADLALTPSERRLHRESEQMFRVLNVAARALVRSMAALGRPLVIRNAGLCDVVSLRGIMRAVEWGRLDLAHGAHVALGEWASEPPLVAVSHRARRRRHLEVMAARMRAGRSPGRATNGVSPSGGRTWDGEQAYLATVLDPGQDAEARIAAAVLAVRTCFYSTNYEGCLLAAETALSLLDSAGGAAFCSRIGDCFDQVDDGHVVPAVEIDRRAVESTEALRALFWRSIGVVTSYNGEYENALQAFERALVSEHELSPIVSARLHMYRGLTLGKHLHRWEEARSVLGAALERLEDLDQDEARLEEGWLRNVLGLTHFAEKRLNEALAEEKLAMRCVAPLHDAEAAHLKINLISNVSVLQETAQKFGDALSTWRRFSEISNLWGDSFYKHHTYRASGLRLKAGDHDSAVAGYTEAYELANKLRDAFHSQVIAVELGRLHFEHGRCEEAVQWYDRAVGSAGEIGDPLRLAQSLAGQALARGTDDLAAVIRTATLSSTDPEQTKKLVAATTTGKDALLSVLPAPKTKLNRPFDLVNLY